MNGTPHSVRGKRVDGASRTRRPRAPAVLRRFGVVVLVTVVLLGLVVVLARDVADEWLYCSPPGRSAQIEQEEFVRTRIIDASNLEWHISDCDDAGTGYLRFHTTLSPLATRAALLTGGQCQIVDESDFDAYGVSCESGSASITVFLEGSDVSGTNGELALP